MHAARERCDEWMLRGSRMRAEWKCPGGLVPSARGQDGDMGRGARFEVKIEDKNNNNKKKAVVDGMSRLLLPLLKLRTRGGGAG